MLMKMVLQGAYGAPASPYFSSWREAEQFRSLIGEYEIAISAELGQGLQSWPELEVMMFFLWPCDGSEEYRVRYIAKERILEVSTCMDPGVFTKLPLAERAHQIFALAFNSFGDGFEKHSKNPESLLLIRDRVIASMHRSPGGSIDPDVAD